MSNTVLVILLHCNVEANFNVHKLCQYIKYLVYELKFNFAYVNGHFWIDITESVINRSKDSLSQGTLLSLTVLCKYINPFGHFVYVY